MSKQDAMTIDVLDLRKAKEVRPCMRQLENGERCPHIAANRYRITHESTGEITTIDTCIEHDLEREVTRPPMGVKCPTCGDKAKRSENNVMSYMDIADGQLRGQESYYYACPNKHYFAVTSTIKGSLTVWSDLQPIEIGAYLAGMTWQGKAAQSE